MIESLPYRHNCLVISLVTNGVMTLERHQPYTFGGQYLRLWTFNHSVASTKTKFRRSQSRTTYQ